MAAIDPGQYKPNF